MFCQTLENNSEMFFNGKKYKNSSIWISITDGIVNNGIDETITPLLLRKLTTFPQEDITFEFNEKNINILLELTKKFNINIIFCKIRKNCSLYPSFIIPNKQYNPNDKKSKVKKPKDIFILTRNNKAEFVTYGVDENGTILTNVKLDALLMSRCVKRGNDEYSDYDLWGEVLQKLIMGNISDTEVVNAIKIILENPEKNKTLLSDIKLNNLKRIKYINLLLGYENTDEDLINIINDDNDFQNDNNEDITEEQLLTELTLLNEVRQLLSNFTL